MKLRWWTCGRGQKNCSREMGTPVCSACEKPAAFTIQPPKGQSGFDFLKKQVGGVKLRERPILMSAPMVRALLEGRKTQTRRVVKPQPTNVDNYEPGMVNEAWQAGFVDVKCPYGKPGDRLWVRESFQPLLQDDVKWGDADYKTGEGYAINYVATDGAKEFFDCRNDEAFCDRVTPSIFMPRWASRITLEVTEVRVQRLQEISEEDAIAEGVGLNEVESYRRQVEVNGFALRGGAPARCAYAALWENINGAGSWDANPWVWAVSFSVDFHRASGPEQYEVPVG